MCWMVSVIRTMDVLDGFRLVYAEVSAPLEHCGLSIGHGSVHICEHMLVFDPRFMGLVKPHAPEVVAVSRPNLLHHQLEAIARSD